MSGFGIWQLCLGSPRCGSSRIEKVQNRAARFVTCNYSSETGSMTEILEKLTCESLEKRRDSKLILLYKSLKGAASSPKDDLIPPNRRSRNHRSLTFQTPTARTDMSSFFPQTIREMPFQIQLFPPLKVQRMVWLGLPLW